MGEQTSVGQSQGAGAEIIPTRPLKKKRGARTPNPLNYAPPGLEVCGCASNPCKT